MACFLKQQLFTLVDNSIFGIIKCENTTWNGEPDRVAITKNKQIRPMSNDIAQCNEYINTSSHMINRSVLNRIGFIYSANWCQWADKNIKIMDWVE
jgi:hypothetical protein